MTKDEFWRWIGENVNFLDCEQCPGYDRGDDCDDCGEKLRWVYERIEQEEKDEYEREEKEAWNRRVNEIVAKAFCRGEGKEEKDD